jgi:hypothetical protein
MQIRRPIAALVTALALFGGGTATLTACGGPASENEGTTDDTGNSESGGDGEGGADEEEDLPDNSDPEVDQNEDTDTIDPD